MSKKAVDVVLLPGEAMAARTIEANRELVEKFGEKIVLDKEKCLKCALCWIYCPDSAIKPSEEGYYEADLYYCKGCGICASICPAEAITMIEEEEK